jgi:hypothetical protein
VELTFTDIATMLTLRVVLTVLNVVRGDDPISNSVSPSSKPNENIATGRLDLLEVHIERSLGFRRQGFDVKWFISLEIDGS